MTDFPLVEMDFILNRADNAIVFNGIVHKALLVRKEMAQFWPKVKRAHQTLSLNRPGARIRGAWERPESGVLDSVHRSPADGT